MSKLWINRYKLKTMSPSSISAGNLYLDGEGDAYLRTSEGGLLLEYHDHYDEGAPFFAEYGPYTDLGPLEILPE